MREERLTSLSCTFCGLVGDRFCRAVDRSQVCGSHSGQADAWLIAVRKFNTSKLKCLLEQHKRGLPSSLRFALEQPNSGYPDMRDIREALLGPVEQASSRPALGGCNHGLEGPEPVSRVNLIVFQLTRFYRFNII